MNNEIEGVCQCCGRRRKGRLPMGHPSENFVCGPCLEDPSPTFEGCKHGIAFTFPAMRIVIERRL